MNPANKLRLYFLVGSTIFFIIVFLLFILLINFWFLWLPLVIIYIGSVIISKLLSKKKDKTVVFDNTDPRVIEGEYRVEKEDENRK